MALVAALAPAPAAARHWAVPDQARLQLAGNVGFLSPGVGYGWLGRRLEADLFFGWVPEALGGDLYSLTAKVTWMPWRVLAAGWTLRPLTGALQLSYALGDEYFLRLPDRYPDHYYAVPTALRGAIAVGAAASRPAFGLPEVGGYVELVALDAMIGAWLDNRRELGLDDVFSVAVGVRVAF